MRKFTISKDDFDRFLYPSVVHGGSQNEAELLIAIRLIKKLQDNELTEIEIIDPLLIEEARRSRQQLIPNRLLRVREATFFVEEDEYELLKKRMLDGIPRYSNSVAIELYDLISYLKSVPEIKMAQPIETREPGPTLVPNKPS